MSLSKKLDRLPLTALEEILEAGKDAKDNPGVLHKIVSDSEAFIIKATKERDANREYQKAKQVAYDLSSGLREVRQAQKAKAALALALLDEENLSAEDDAALDQVRSQVFANQQSRKRESA